MRKNSIIISGGGFVYPLILSAIVRNHQAEARNERRSLISNMLSNFDEDRMQRIYKTGAYFSIYAISGIFWGEEHMLPVRNFLYIGIPGSYIIASYLFKCITLGYSNLIRSQLNDEHQRAMDEKINGFYVQSLGSVVAFIFLMDRALSVMQSSPLLSNNRVAKLFLEAGIMFTYSIFVEELGRSHVNSFTPILADIRIARSRGITVNDGDVENQENAIVPPMDNILNIQ